MSLRDNKMLILRKLGMEPEPISLQDLMNKLEGEFKERSVRRWLSLLIRDGAIKKVGQKRGTKYFVIGRSKEPNKEISSCFSSASLEAIKLIKKPLFEREPKAYNDDWVNSYLPNSSYYLEKSLRDQLFESGKRANGPAGTYAQQIFNRLIIDLSYNSSRLEGNTYSLLDTERLLLYGDIATGKLDEEKVMILNHKEAIRYLVDNASALEINSNTIYTIHFLLSDGLVAASEAGKVRRYGVRIGGSTYIPFEDPKRLELQLERITSKAALIRDPYEQSIFLLVHLSYLQSFIDVNKRVARLSANIPLIKNNLVPLAFSDVPVDDYMSAMIAVYEQQDVLPLVDLYFYSYMRTCAAYDSTVKAMGFDEIRVRYRKERRSIIREIILQGLVKDALKSYVIEETHKLIPLKNQESFINDVMEDIAEMDKSRIFGLGISLEQLQSWQKLSNL